MSTSSLSHGINNCLVTLLQLTKLCAQWARQMVTAILTIWAKQTYSGTELDPKLRYLCASVSSQGLFLCFINWQGQQKLSVKADLLIYSNFITVSGQCTSVGIIINNKMDFNFCAYMEGFCESMMFLHVLLYISFKIARLHVLTNRFGCFLIVICITQLFCHVSLLLTSACRQAYLNT